MQSIRTSVPAGVEKSGDPAHQATRIGSSAADRGRRMSRAEAMRVRSASQRSATTGRAKLAVHRSRAACPMACRRTGSRTSSGHGAGQRISVVDAHQESSASVLENRRGAGHPGRHDREPAQSGLDEHSGHSLTVGRARKDEHIGFLEERHHVLLEPGDLYSRSLRVCVESGSQRPVAHHGGARRVDHRGAGAARVE